MPRDRRTFRDSDQIKDIKQESPKRRVVNVFLVHTNARVLAVFGVFGKEVKHDSPYFVR